MELWDAYDRDGNKLDRHLPRDEPIPDGQYHLVVHVIVRHEDDEYLLMRRDESKLYYPGFWETGAAGAVLKDESPIDGAKRELYEETGIASDELKAIDRQVSHDTIYMTYLCITDIQKDSVTIQPGETSAYRWVSRDKLIEAMNCDDFVGIVRERSAAYMHKI